MRINQLILTVLFMLFSPQLFSIDKVEYFLESHQPYYIGELGERWQFPSDHLPRGATLGNVHIAFWNILYKNYLFHIEENGQGLRKSSILIDNRPSDENPKLTVREVKSLHIIFEMITHPTHPRSMIALQEMHKDVKEHLNLHLPSNWKIATPEGQPNSQDVFLYDSNVFDYVDNQSVKYSPDQTKTIFTLTLREKSTNKNFRFLQSHIPGGPNSPQACIKFSEEALKQYNPNITTVLMGDMNQSPEVIQQALSAAAKKKKIVNPFKYLPINHPSHVNTKMEAAWIDNFFVYSNEVSILGSDFPAELSSSLDSVVDVLKGESKE